MNSLSYLWSLSLTHSLASRPFSTYMHIYIYLQITFRVHWLFSERKELLCRSHHSCMCVCVCVFRKNSSNSIFSFVLFSFGFLCVFRVNDEMTEWLVDFFLDVILLSGYFSFICCFVYLCIYSEVKRTVVADERQHTYQRHFVDGFFNSC